MAWPPGDQTGTPSVTHSDSLGRAVLTVTHNRTKYSNAAPQDELAETRTVLEMNGSDERLDLESALRGLTDQQRLVLVLHYYLDLPMEEVAATLGISKGAAKSRVHRAVRALRPAVESMEVRT